MNLTRILIIVVIVAVIVAAVVATTVVLTRRSGNFELSIVHLNDFHARFEETSTSSAACRSDDCIGGFSRVYTAVNRLMNERTNPIFLNAGDNFQGTLWFTLFGWNVTQLFLNMLPTDVYTLGNHEFDNGIAGVVPFLQSLNAPVVVSNIDDSLEPTIQGLYEKSTVIEKYGKRIGVVGVIISTTNELSSTEKLRFLDESESVNAEAQRLLDEENVFTVIVLSHCGYDIDQEIARKAIPGISIIVGSHSHTLLYTGTPPLDSAYGEYPTVIENSLGDPVLIVQASAYTKYLGDLVVEFDDEAKLLRWEGNPVYLDQSIPQDAEINELLEPFRLEVEASGNIVLGTSNVRLQYGECRKGECNSGSFLADAMVAYYSNLASNETWTKASIAFINAGGIRAPIERGDITYNDLATSQPFSNTVDYAELQGKYIKEALEFTALPYTSMRVSVDINLLQVSGLRVVMDMSRPSGDRITSLKVRCHQCDVPEFEDIDLEAYYPIAVISFLAAGGDGFTAISDNIINHIEGPIDIDIYSEYIQRQAPVTAGLDERIQIVSEEEIRVIYHG